MNICITGKLACALARIFNCQGSSAFYTADSDETPTEVFFCWRLQSNKIYTIEHLQV